MRFKLFSQRKFEAERSGVTDVYCYDKIGDKLRIQMQQILDDALGRYYVPGPYDMSSPANNNTGWDMIHKIMCRELGTHRLARESDAKSEIMSYIGSCDVEQFIDLLDVVAAYLHRVIGDKPPYALDNMSIKQVPAEALEEINYRMRADGFGFQIACGQMMRVDSEYTHEEIVKPALRVLSAPGFEGAEQEFLEAHGHYRTGDHKQAIVSAAKAFESALKSVCVIKGWEYEKSARASDLLKIFRSRGLWPDYLDASFDQLLATLASGLPRVRNDIGAHGQGPIPSAAPEYVASYALNLCAAKIRLVAEAALQ